MGPIGHPCLEAEVSPVWYPTVGVSVDVHVDVDAAATILLCSVCTDWLLIQCSDQAPRACCSALVLVH